MEKETIFIVDDNRQIADFWAKTLLPDLGYKTLVAYNGRSALEILRHHPVSLMLIDLHLPDMSGLDVLRQLADEGRTVPTILATAHGSEEIAVESFHLGVQDYLTKPVDSAQLNEALTRALSVSRLRREKSLLTAQLREQVKNQMIMGRIGQSVISTLHLDEVLRRIVHAAVELTHAEEGFIALPDEHTDRLYLRAVWNIAEEKAKTMRLPVTDTLVGEALSQRKAIRSNRQSDHEQLIKVSTGFLVHSLMHMPIIHRDQPLGVLSVVNHSSARPFQEKDEASLAALAGYAAIAIDNAILYERAQQVIAERMRAEEALRTSEERYALAAESANDGIWDWDLLANALYLSARWKSILGYKPSEIGSDPDEWLKRVHPDDLDKVRVGISAYLERHTEYLEIEHRLQHKNGEYRWMLCRGKAVWDANDQANRLAGSLTDITDRRNNEQRLLQNAFYDQLTGLANRALFNDRLTMAIQRGQRRSDYLFAVLFLDLDRFKDINDSLGHFFGDRLLIAIARILEKRLRPTDTVARFGGDEFVILLDDIRLSTNATQIADWIQDALNSPITVGVHEVYISASIGIVLSETGYSNPADVLRDADIAMYHAKSSGKAHFEIFDPLMRTRIMERLEMENNLRRAFEKNELRVYYQIIVSLETGNIKSLEALVRWQHPSRGLLEPKDFLPLAEETGLIVQIDRWVTQEACQQLHKWQQEFPWLASLGVSVNFSSKQFVQKDLLTFIQKVLTETQVNPECLTVEITENIIVDNRDDIIELCNHINDLGVHVQIDDFGSGYSSLSYLSKFQFNALKIDRSFIKKIVENRSEAEIVQAIVLLSHRLGIGVIAEGVETEGQLAQLKGLGCEYGQGYLLSEPVPEATAVRFLVDNNRT